MLNRFVSTAHCFLQARCLTAHKCTTLLISGTASWQVINLTQQLANGKPHSAKSRQQPLHDSQAAPGFAATADDIGHLHAQVEGVGTTTTTLRALASEPEQQLLRQQLQLQELQQQQQQQPPEQCHAAALKLLKQQLKQPGEENKLLNRRRSRSVVRAIEA